MDWLGEVVTGLTIGLTILVVHGAFLFFAKKQRRKKQKDRLRLMVQWHLREMALAKDKKISDGGVLQKEVVLAVLFDSLCTEMDAFFSHRDSEIKYEDERALKIPFLALNQARRRDPKYYPTMETYQEYFLKDLRQIEWLGLKA